eukprot:3055823-Rhodomonas_salina.1
MLAWEWVESRKWIGCDSDQEASLELTSPILSIQANDVCNLFRKAAMKLGTTVEWDPVSSHSVLFSSLSLAATTRAQSPTSAKAKPCRQGPPAPLTPSPHRSAPPELLPALTSTARPAVEQGGHWQNNNTKTAQYKSAT